MTAGIVLAGGRSHRMGQDKARLLFGDSTLLGHVVRVLTAVADSMILVAESANAYDDLDIPLDVRVVADLYPGQGPVGGVVTGMRAAGEGIHTVVGCDMPRLNPDLLRLLMDEARGFDAAVPEVDGRLEPLCAAYDYRCVDQLESRLLAGERALHKAVRALRLKVVPESTLRQVDPDLASFININTPDDYQPYV